MGAQTVDVEGHTLEIDADGVTTPGHPENDIVDCGFEAYVADSWGNPGAWHRPSSWEFTRLTNDETGQVYWNSSRLDSGKGPG